MKPVKPRVEGFVQSYEKIRLSVKFIRVKMLGEARKRERQGTRFGMVSTVVFTVFTIIILWYFQWYLQFANHRGSIFKVFAMGRLPYLLKSLIISCGIFR